MRSSQQGTFAVKLIPCSIILLLAAGARAQNEPHTQPAEEIGPVYTHGQAGITAPRPIYTPDPEYPVEARKAHHQGLLVLWMIVGPDGGPHSIRVARSLGLGLDEKAIEAVRQWKFEPAIKDGKPVAVQMNIEVRFQLYEDYCCLVEVLSDTTGVDFNPYLASVLDDVRSRWHKLVPKSSASPKEKEVTIQFAILRDGRAAHVQIASPSGEGSLDHAAQEGVAKSSPFKPLPSEFRGKELAVRMQFLYSSVVLAISPESVQVALGSVQQFSAAVGSTKNPHVNWSISGDGCSGAECGSISAAGLYTAPVESPKPPIVRVSAVLMADPSRTASALVIIVKSRGSTH